MAYWKNLAIEIGRQVLGDSQYSDLPDFYQTPPFSNYSYPGKVALPPAKRVKLSPKLSKKAELVLTRTEEEKKKKRSGGPTYTMGFYAPRFRKRKAPSVSKYYKDGSVLKYEHGGEVSRTHTVYIGHGIAGASAVQSICRAIMHKMLLKMGYVPRMPREQLQTQTGGPVNLGTFALVYRLGAHLAPATGATFLFAATDTFLTLADKLNTVLTQAMDVEHSGLEFISLEFQYEGNTGGALTVLGPKKELDLQRMTVDFNWKSKITLQNRCVGSSPTGASTELSTDVENNPVVGKVYMGMGNTLEPRLYRLTASLTGLNSFAANKEYGLLNFNSDEAGTGLSNNDLRHPPNHGFFKNVKKLGGCRLQPGQIRNGFLSYSKVASLKWFIDRLTTVGLATSSSSNGRTTIGKVEMYALTLMCDSGVAEEPSVKIGYEINSEFKTRVWSKKDGMHHEFYQV